MKFNDNNKLTKIITGATLVASVFIAAYLFQFSYLGFSNDNAVWGTFGDYVGGSIGTVLNFTGVILLYLTFKAQMEVSDAQFQASNIQQFESTFFNLLANQRAIVNNLSGDFNVYDSYSVYPDSETKEGDAYIDAVAKQMERLAPNIERLGSDIETNIRITYKQVYDGKEAELDHYFRHLYHIVKYTDEAPIPNKRKYVDIIQAQMSDNEFYLAFYNGLSEYGKPRFWPLMEKYQFVENVRDRSEAFNAQKATFYPAHD